MQLSKSKSTRKIALWLSSIVNHFWYCCSQAKGDTTVLKVSKYIYIACGGLEFSIQDSICVYLSPVRNISNY